MITLTPAMGEPEFGDVAMVGDFAAKLPKMLDGTQAPPWCSYTARQEGVPVGMGGFKGAVDTTGAVEIGYLTFRPAEGRGIAREVARQLVEIAREGGAKLVCAHTLRENNPSTRVLRAHGFAGPVEVLDPEDGPVWRWEKQL